MHSRSIQHLSSYVAGERERERERGKERRERSNGPFPPPPPSPPARLASQSEYKEGRNSLFIAPTPPPGLSCRRKRCDLPRPPPPPPGARAPLDPPRDTNWYVEEEGRGGGFLSSESRELEEKEGGGGTEWPLPECTFAQFPHSNDRRLWSLEGSIMLLFLCCLHPFSSLTLKVRKGIIQMPQRKRNSMAAHFLSSFSKTNQTPSAESADKVFLCPSPTAFPSTTAAIKGGESEKRRRQR